MAYFIRVFCLGFGLMSSLVLSAAADTVVLKSQRTIKGTVTEQNEKFIKVKVGGGVPVTYYRDQVESVTVESESSEKNFLWRIKTSKATVFLFGSLHLGKKDMYPLSRSIEDAFAQSDLLVLEINMEAVDKNAVQKMIREKALYPPGEKLINNLSAETRKKLQGYLMPRGILIDQFMPYEPWFVAMMLTKMQINLLGFSEEWGVDKYFSDRAKETGKEILELESIESQLDFLNSLPNQDLFLRYSLVSLSETETMLNQIIDSWSSGDAKQFEDMLIVQTLKESPEMEPVLQKILYERNRLMVKKIEELIEKEGRYFVVVGAAHLVGKEGVVDLLNKAGYPAEQL